MRLLSELAARFVRARFGGQHALGELGLDVLAGFVLGNRRDVDRVGSHVGDQTDGFAAADRDAFVQLLSDDHRALGLVAKLAAGFLLQGAGGERRVGVALTLGFLDVDDRPGRAVEILFDQGRLDAGLQVDLFAGALDQIGRKRRLARAVRTPGQLCLQRPVLDGNELQDLFFAIDHHAHGDRLNAPSGQAAPNLPAQERADRVADQAIYDAPRLLGIDAIHVDAARALHGGQHRTLGDLVEFDACDLLVAIKAERGDEMPGNGLALTVGVSGE